MQELWGRNLPGTEFADQPYRLGLKRMFDTLGIFIYR